MHLTPSSTSNYHLFTLFIGLLVLVHNQQISASSFSNRPNYQSHPSIYNDYSYDDNSESESPILINPHSYYPTDSEEIIPRNPWSELFHRFSQRSVYNPAYYSPSLPGFNLRNGEIHYISYPAQKRAIPIEFQKALFAHGIVGRRR